MSEDEIIPIDEDTVELVHPAVDMSRDDKAYIGAWILSEIPSTRSIRLDYALYIITSNKQMVKAKRIGKTFSYGDIVVRYTPASIGYSNWGKKAVERFCNNETNPEPLEIYSMVKNEIKRYVDFYDPRWYDFYTLWIIGSYFYTIFDAFPYVYVGGWKRTGKTKTLMLAKCMAFNGILSNNMSSSSLFRLVQNARCTLLIDETERLDDPKRMATFRSLLTEGYKRSGIVFRTERRGKSERHTPVPFEVYSPKILANIAGLDSVLEDRCIRLIMRRSNNIKIINTVVKQESKNWQKIRDNLFAFALTHYKDVRCDAEIPVEVEGVYARELELWRPMLVLARLFSMWGVKLEANEVAPLRQKCYTSTPLHQSKKDISLFDIIKHLAQDEVRLRKAEEVTEARELILIQAVVGIVQSTSWYKLSDIRKAMESFYEDKQNWLNNQWISRALKRYGFKERRRVARGVQYYLKVLEVHSLAYSMGFNIKDILKEGLEAEKEEPEEQAPVVLD